MIRGLYTSGWSMIADNKRMDVIANNLANVNTVGYKKDKVINQSFPEVLTKRINDTQSRLNPSGNIGQMRLGSDIGEIFTYYTQGSLTSTENKLDLAIKNSDSSFFTVASLDENKEYYTRNGSFKLDTEGYLITEEGYRVMGLNGAIQLYGEDFSVSPDGTIVENGEVVDILLIKNFENTETLRKLGNNLIETTDETVEREFDGQVEQGYLEQSNVDIISEMVEMITVMRSYEANQKILQYQDSTLDRAVNEVGRLR